MEFFYGHPSQIYGAHPPAWGSLDFVWLPWVEVYHADTGQVISGAYKWGPSFVVYTDETGSRQLVGPYRVRWKD
jgi:hypothetical protein